MRSTHPPDLWIGDAIFRTQDNLEYFVPFATQILIAPEISILEAELVPKLVSKHCSGDCMRANDDASAKYVSGIAACRERHTIFWEPLEMIGQVDVRPFFGNTSVQIKF